MRRIFPCGSVIVALILVISCGAIEAQTWRITSGSAWSTAANWGGAVPTQDGTADLLFSQIGNPLLVRGMTTMDLDWNIHSITWNATSLDNSGIARINVPALSTTTLTLQAGLNNGSGGQVEVYPNIVLGAFQIWNDTTTPPPADTSLRSGTFVFGTISGTGGIQKTGSGTLHLVANINSYAGGTTITGGALEVSSGDALGSAASIQIDNGTLRFASYGGNALAVALAQNLVLGANGGTIQTRRGDVTLNGLISGGGQLRLDPDSSGNFFTQSRYSLARANTYTGGTVLGAVTVDLTGFSQSLGTGGVTVKSDGVLGLSAETNLAPGRKVALEEGGVLVLNNAAINPAHIIDSNPANTTGGTLSLGRDYGSALDMASLGNGQLFLGSTGTVSYNATTLGAGAGGVYRLGGGSGARSAFAPLSILIFAGTDNLLTGARSVVIGSTSAFQTSDARGFSTVVFRNPNNYSGGTTLVGGTLAVGHNQALGSRPLTITAGNLAGHLNSDGGARTITNPVIFDSPEGATFYLGGADNLTLTGPVDLGGTAHVFSGGNPRTIFTNTISRGSLTLNGGIWSLGGANSFAGGLSLANYALLDFSSDGNLGAPGSVLTLQGGILRPATSLGTSRRLVVSSSGGTVDTNGQILTFSGPVSSGGPLTKRGAGTLIFSGSGKSFGTVTIAQGTLRLDDTGSSNGMQVIVQNGATLGGNGSAGYTTLNPGGHFAPGTDTPGSFLFNSNFNLTPGAVLDFDLGLTLFDKIILRHGTLTKQDGSGPVLVNIFDAGGLAPGQTYTLIDWTAANESIITAADFQIANSPVGGSFSVAGKTLQLTTPNIPEPTSIPLLIVGAWSLFAGRRRSQ